MKLEELLNTPDTTEQFEVKDIEENKIYSIFSYISILFLIPLLACPKSKFARFHTNQGIVYFIVSLVAGIVSGIVTAILALIPVVGAIVGALISIAIGLANLALLILGIVNAATGKAKELPIIGKIRLLK